MSESIREALAADLGEKRGIHRARSAAPQLPLSRLLEARVGCTPLLVEPSDSLICPETAIMQENGAKPPAMTKLNLHERPDSWYGNYGVC